MDRIISRAVDFVGMCCMLGVFVGMVNAESLLQVSQTQEVQQAQVVQQTQPDPRLDQSIQNKPNEPESPIQKSAASLQDTQNPQQNLKEGVDYIVLKTPIPNAQNSLIEVYSYACPFCFKYSKILPQIMSDLPESTTLHLYHLEQKGDYGKLASQILAVLIVKDRQAGIDILDERKSAFQRAKNAYFDEYHIQRNRWKDGRDPEGFLRTGLLAAGVSEQEFQQALQTPEVEALLSQWQASYDIAIIQGVPAFVVNGKYLIKTSELKSLDDLGEKIQALLGR
ncbi:thiol:disulfide interchange protein DsbA/DsbL [uncultured Helicobacter sp.]|mgnify:CR=1 FL=1|uniref:thiol:disulfide interchange protein DsbA/DsbL n=1 Tax=uncultured Helicobacter sp. TaxID=175537 RepID=UPI00262FD89C|nr:thiol:disulfide interchange protein DsbA/DsbL [uncultured Helicobacter sp.]